MELASFPSAISAQDISWAKILGDVIHGLEQSSPADSTSPSYFHVNTI